MLKASQKLVAREGIELFLKKLTLCKLCLIVFGALLAVQSI